MPTAVIVTARRQADLLTGDLGYDREPDIETRRRAVAMRDEMFLVGDAERRRLAEGGRGDAVAIGVGPADNRDAGRAALNLLEALINRIAGRHGAALVFRTERRYLIERQIDIVEGLRCVVLEDL